MAASQNHTSASLSNKSIAYLEEWRKELLKGDSLVRESDLSVARMVDMLIDHHKQRKELNKKQKV